MVKITQKSDKIKVQYRGQSQCFASVVEMLSMCRWLKCPERLQSLCKSEANRCNIVGCKKILEFLETDDLNGI